jgi:hypothetical protein
MPDILLVYPYRMTFSPIMASVDSFHDISIKWGFGGSISLIPEEELRPVMSRFLVLANRGIEAWKCGSKGQG